MPDTGLDRLRDIVLFVSGIVAVGSLILAAFEGFNQRVGSALFLGTLGVVCIFLLFMPKLEVFKVWGVEAKLQQTVTEAVATLATVKRLTEISAKASYLTIAWANRFDGPRAVEKQAVLDDINVQLAELKVSASEVENIQRPFVKMVRLDLFYLFKGVLMSYARILNGELHDKVHKATDPSVASGLVMQHSDLITAWSKRTENVNASVSLERQSLENLLNEFMPKQGEWLGDKDLAVIQKFKNEIVRLNADCEKKGGFTTEAAIYYDRYTGDHNVDRALQLRNEVQQ